MIKRVILCFIFLLIYLSTRSIALERAYNPWPPDGSTGVSINTDFAWDHDGDSSSLYSGTTPGNLQRLLYRSTAKSFDLYSSLSLNKRYYWRVDVHNGNTTVTGKVWTFRTRSSSVGVVVGCNIARHTGIFSIIFFLPLFFLKQK